MTDNDVVPLVPKKTPAETALDLSAIFTEFSPKKPEWTKPLVEVFGGSGKAEEGQLRYLCVGARLNHNHLRQLVSELVRYGFISDFFLDRSALSLIGWGALAKPCREYIDLQRRLRQIREQRSREVGQVRQHEPQRRSLRVS